MTAEIGATECIRACVHAHICTGNKVCVNIPPHRYICACLWLYLQAHTLLYVWFVWS